MRCTATLWPSQIYRSPGKPCVRSYFTLELPRFTPFRSFLNTVTDSPALFWHFERNVWTGTHSKFNAANAVSDWFESKHRAHTLLFFLNSKQSSWLHSVGTCNDKSVLSPLNITRSSHYHLGEFACESPTHFSISLDPSVQWRINFLCDSIEPTLNEKMEFYFKLSSKDARTIIGAANRSNGLQNGIFPSCWPHCTYVWRLRHSSNANVCLYASDVCPFGSSAYTYTRHTRNTQTHCQTLATFDAIFRALLSRQIYY